MSENNNGEVDRSVPVSSEDCDNVRNYSLHFGVGITETLNDVMSIFEKDPSYENMIDFKRELCQWLVECGHESFTDSLWEHPTEAAKDILYDLNFDKEVQDVLNEPRTEKQEELTNELNNLVKKELDK
jgi:hypothetical protein